MGDERDLIKTWQRTYRTNQWNRIAPFNAKGKVSRAYLLFKAKNIIDPSTRARKYSTKGRPIAPGTKHPMRRLLHLAGRAWSFIASNIDGDHFAIQHGGRLTAFLRRAEQLPGTGSLD